MPLYKRRTYSGAVLEQEIFHIAPNTKRLRAAEPKPPPFKTEQERQAYNDKQSLKRFIQNVNANFGPWSWYVTLTFHDKHLPDDFDEARPILNNYIRRLQYINPDMVAVAVMGRGIKTDRIHFHLIVSGVDREAITGKWPFGSVKRAEKLRPRNVYDGKDHGQDYTGLATYLFMHWTPEQGGGKRWRQTRNMKPPDKHRPRLSKRTYTEKKPPVTPKGYMLVDSKCTKYGYQYFKYVLIPNSGAHPLKC